MSDTTRFPFDSIPLDGAAGGTAVMDPPRPSFSRSVPDLSATGLLPPTRKPVAVTVPELPPTTPPADEPTTPNPMASTPPPKAGSVRGLLWDLVRPTRTKGAILAGGISLVAGAYGLNLVTPPAPPPPSKRELVEVAQLTGPMPQIVDERRAPPSIGEERVAAPPVVGKEYSPTPLPAPAAIAVPPPEPVKVVRHEQPADPPAPPSGLPPLKTVDLVVPPTPPKSDGLPPVLVGDEKPKATPLPAVSPEKLEPATPPPEVAPLPAVVMPGAGEKEPELPVAPKPVGFVERPEPEQKPDPLPPPPVNDPKPAALPVVKLTSASDEKPPPAPALPPVGTPAAEPPKPVEGTPIPKPAIAEMTPVDLISPPPVKADPIPAPPFTEKKPDVSPPVTPLKSVPVAEKKPDLIPAPVFKETPSPAVTNEPPPAPVGAPPPKKGFEVEVVKVRATDTYTSISEAFYQSRKYASALRAFNGDADISRLQEVEVPPLFELQKLTNTPTREAEPTGRTVIPVRGSTPTEPAVRGPVTDQTGDAGETLDWAPQGKKRPLIKYEKFTTPKEGMTARDVARAVYADENEWAKLIGPRGAKLRADDRLPRGTELTVPREELPWK